MIVGVECSSDVCGSGAAHGDGGSDVDLTMILYSGVGGDVNGGGGG